MLKALISAGVIAELIAHVQEIWMYIRILFFAVTFVMTSVLEGERDDSGILLRIQTAFITGTWVMDDERCEAEMQKSEIFKPIAQTLVSYCQTRPKIFPKYLGREWFPKVIENVGYPYGEVFTDSARIQLGGGFHNYGYWLHKNTTKSTAQTNTWEFGMESEGKPAITLYTFQTATTNIISSDDILQRVKQRFEEEIAEHPQNNNKRMELVTILLMYDKLEEAFRTTEVWIKNQPKNVPGRLTLAHLKCRLGKKQAAAHDFESWVRDEPDFERWIYLALFNFREGKRLESLMAVGEALNQPFMDKLDSSESKFYLGCNGALIAFEYKEYTLCLKMCNKMLNDSQPNEQWHDTINKLASAALVMMGKTSVGIKILSRIPEDLQTQDIMSAIKGNNLGYFQDHKKWLGLTFITPYQPGKTRILGTIRSPNPYP